MLKPVPIEMILAAQQLVTAYGTVDHCQSYSGYLNDGSAYIDFSAKLPMTAKPHVKITIQEDEVTAMVHVMTDMNALTGAWSNDFKYFLPLTNRIYTPEEFVQACRDFWFKRGKSGLAL